MKKQQIGTQLVFNEISIFSFLLYICLLNYNTNTSQQCIHNQVIHLVYENLVLPAPSYTVKIQN